MFKLIVYVVILCCAFNNFVNAGLHEEFSWTRISYVWPKQNGKSVVSENYIHENNIPQAVNVWKNKMFISMPRRAQGIPSTLNYIDLNSKNKKNVPLIPYPDWKTNKYPTTSNYDKTFVSVYRVSIDSCDRIWFVDTGELEIPGNRTRIKPITLYIMDLNKDKIINSYKFPESSYTSTSSFASITVDASKNKCQDAYAYIPDLSGYGLTVFSLLDNRSWRVKHKFFFPEPQADDLNIANHKFQWADGIFSTELSDVKPDGYKDVYFHSMMGTHMYRVSTRILKNETLATRSYHGDDFVDIGNKGKNTHTSSAFIHPKSGVMFMNFVNKNAVGCWNTASSFKKISIVQKDDQKMIYPADIKVYNDRVYALTNTLPEFVYGKLNYDKVNFRVWSNTIDNAIKGTMCENRK